MDYFNNCYSNFTKLFIFNIYIINDKLSLEVIFKLDFFMFLLVWILTFYLASHLFIPIKKIYDFIYEKRYAIAFLILAIIVLGKFNGSSYGAWNTYIEPKDYVTSLKPILGAPRYIRSDEWLVNFTYQQAQAITGYNYFNPLMRATPTDVFATVPAPVLSIMTIVKPFFIGFILFGKDYGMSFYWYGRFICLFLVTFELFMILTKKKKIASLIGALSVSFAPAIYWWYSSLLIEMLVGGNLAIVMFYHFLQKKSFKEKIIPALMIGFGFSIYFFTLYPAWMVPLGYLYLCLALYLLYDYLKDNKFHIKDFVPLLISIGFFGLFLAIFMIKSSDTLKVLLQTVYPGSRFSRGGYGYPLMFYYPVAIYYPFFDYPNPCENGTFYSLFPMVLVLAIYYLIKERKKWRENLLLIIMVCLTIVLFIVSSIEIPAWLAKISLFSSSMGPRVAVIASLTSVFVLILLIDKIKLTTKKEKIILPIILILLSIYTIYEARMGVSPLYVSKNKTIFALLLLLIPTLSILSQKKAFKILFAGSIIVITLESTVLVNPIMKGTNGIYEKPISQELQKLKDNDYRFAALDSIFVGNYLAMNGLKVINTTNAYPNLDLWHKLDPEKKYEDVYNRYAHVTISLTDDDIEFSSTIPDQVVVKIPSKELCTLDVDYVTSMEEIPEKYNNENVSFKKIYSHDNILIYKVDCQGV